MPLAFGACVHELAATTNSPRCQFHVYPFTIPKTAAKPLGDIFHPQSNWSPLYSSGRGATIKSSKELRPYNGLPRSRLVLWFNHTRQSGFQAKLLWRLYYSSTGQARELRRGNTFHGILPSSRIWKSGPNTASRRIHPWLTNIGPLHRAVRMAIDGKTSAIVEEGLAVSHWLTKGLTLSVL
jgi:hypothetical protein